MNEITYEDFDLNNLPDEPVKIIRDPYRRNHLIAFTEDYVYVWDGTQIVKALGSECELYDPDNKGASDE